VGAPVYTFGFPYAEVLSAAGNFTLGNVTALRGEGNDTRTLQMSAPVQSGNSGGPLLNAKGAVVGILRAKMTLVHDDIAQNANFAIRSALAVNYINSENITLATISPVNAPNLAPEDIAEKAKKFTVQVLCK
jgi:serine protease Do